jgi:hypothetical protein
MTAILSKRIASLQAALAVSHAAAQTDRADLASELTSGLLVNSIRLAGWAQRLARHESDAAALERAIQELSLIACCVDDPGSLSVQC